MITVIPCGRILRRTLALAAAGLWCATSSAVAQHASHAATVQIAPPDAKVTVGQQAPFVATAYDAAGNPLPDATFEWKSSNPSVASIDQSGIAVGLSPGLAIITVRTGTGSSAKSAQAPVEVVAAAPVAPPPPPAPARVSLNPTNADLAVGGHLRFVAAASDTAGHPFSGAVLLWSSSDSAVARVDSGGTVTGVSPGLAIIAVRTGTGEAMRRAEAPVRVEAARAPVTAAAPTPAAPSPAAAPQLQPQRAVGGPAPAPTAVDSLRRACGGGTAASCASLGALYESGRGVTANLDTARVLEQRGCDLGDGPACRNVGALYAMGRGVPRDYAHAAQLFQRGCDLGAPGNCVALAQLYQRGLGVPVDSARARELLQRACKGRDRQACMELRRGGGR